jgi:hypothetical protein
MPAMDPIRTAKSMIQLHGSRAQAVAMERAAEMRVKGDTEGQDAWEQVCSAIRELRQTAHQTDRTRH